MWLVRPLVIGQQQGWAPSLPNGPQCRKSQNLRYVFLASYLLQPLDVCFPFFQRSAPPLTAHLPKVDPRRKDPDQKPSTNPIRMPVIDTDNGQMDVISRLLKDRILLLGQQVDDEVANVLVAQLLYLAVRALSHCDLMLQFPV